MIVKCSGPDAKTPGPSAEPPPAQIAVPSPPFLYSANARYEAELKAVTKKHGFKNFAEYEAVAASISLVMAAIDSQTQVFTDPPTAIQQELEDATAAKNIPSSEKKNCFGALLWR